VTQPLGAAKAARPAWSLTPEGLYAGAGPSAPGLSLVSVNDLARPAESAPVDCGPYVSPMRYTAAVRDPSVEAAGGQALRFAGEAAAELKVGGSANPDLVPVMRERIGNDDVRIVLGAITVVDEDGERARETARREVAMYLSVVAELDPTISIDAEVPLDRFAFAGTPGEVVAHAEAVFEAGAGRIDFGNPHGFDLLCTQVLPHLR
jgi:5,10-methylenetetrahydromethanopterin reductase